jgi:lysophospholipid acyltransferase (LPLAT)-like uncharacterized protein
MPAAGVKLLTSVPKPASAQKPTFLQTLVSFIAGTALKLLALTLRVKWHDGGTFYARTRKPVILCIWHNRLLGSILADWRAAQRCHPVKVLTSASKDGGWLAAMARRFTLGAVRGSSSRRGAAALIELSRAIRDGNDIVITPDGPRGPNYSIAPGIVHLAGRAGVRIVPVKVGFTRFWRIGKKWDALWIPKPFSRLTLEFLEPLEFTGDADALKAETARLADVMGRD